MSRIPATALKDVPQSCPICSRKFKNKASLIGHVGNVHKEQIPEKWTPSRYENYARTGKDHGVCIVCKNDTEWNESTWKYNRLCNNPACKKKVCDQAKKNMKRVYGKTNLLDDPEMQRKMIYAKRNSGKYHWSEDITGKYENLYDSKTSESFLEMLDVFLNFNPEDVFSPSPNTYPYQYEGKTHQYIPDHYIASLNLEVEIKESKDNPNMHPKIQAVDKVKERLKDEAMYKRPDVNYIKINGTDYSEFFAYLTRLKSEPDAKPVPSKLAVKEELLLPETPEYLQLQTMIMEASSLSQLEDITYHMNKILDTADPQYNYKRRIQDLNKQYKKCKTMKDYDKLRKEVVMIQADLDRVAKSEKGNNRMRFEAEKTKKILNDTLLKDIDYRISKLNDGIKQVDKLPVEEALSIEATRNEKQYKPVFIFLSFTGTPFGRVIRSFTGQEFSHASLSLDTTLDKMISFGSRSDGRMGFAPDESIHKGGYTADDAYYGLYMYMAPQHEYEAMVSVVNEFVGKADKLKYSFKGCVNLARGQETHDENEYFCSEFVSKVLAAANPKLLAKDPSLYTPGDLASVRKFTKISEGKVKNYNEKETDRTVQKILKRRGFKDVQIDY